MIRYLVPLLLVAMIISVGCDVPTGVKKTKKTTVAKKTEAEKNEKKSPPPKPERKKRKLPGAWDSDTEVTSTAMNNGGGNAAGGNQNFGMQVDQAQHVVDEVRDSVEYGPTLVVWLVDSTAPSATLRGQVSNAVRKFYGTPLPAGAAEDQLLSVVLPFDDRAPTDLPEPTAKAADVSMAFDKLPQGANGLPATFATLQAAATKYAPLRSANREVMFIVVTAQRGGDWQPMAEAPIALLKKSVIPVYVIGWPAPLGKEALGNKSQAELGPESRYKEAIEIESLTGGFEFEYMDSGFGPFALEWLARETNGKFVAIRPYYQPSEMMGPFSMAWPSGGARQFDAAVMKKYAPDYVSEADYQAILKGNAACRALHQAAKLSRVEVQTNLGTRFAKRNEAQFANDLSKAQQGAAKLEPDIERLYEALVSGEADRSKLTSPRWQAQYDVAMGRACAAKARIEGYNAMLAMLKTGKNFTQPTSTTWVLMPDDTTQAGSSIVKLVDRSQMYLKRVVAEHPGTPWALLAERELASQVGWKWTEE